MSFAPLVSIVIPVYNGSNYVSQAIDSALAQIYRKIEVLVINDGSDDGGETERIALSYGAKIRYYKKPNGGVASALNVAISEMSGEYFSWLSHDDLYVRDKVKRQVEALSLLLPIDRDRTIVYSNYDVFTTDPEKSIPGLLRGVASDMFRYWLTTENTLHGCTLLIPKSAFVEAGRFKETLRTTQDYDLWFRMARNYRFVYLPERLVKARSHSEQGSIKMSALALRECNTLLAGFIDDLSCDEILRSTQNELSAAYAQIAASMWERNFFGAGRLAMGLSLTYFKQSSFRSNALAICLFAKGFLMHAIIKPIRSIISPRTRLAIRRWLLFTKKREGTGGTPIR